jgi:hypothetical protein
MSQTNGSKSLLKIDRKVDLNLFNVQGVRDENNKKLLFTLQIKPSLL